MVKNAMITHEITMNFTQKSYGGIMQKKTNFWTINYIKPLLYILLFSIFIEVFVCNISYWKTLGCEPVVLSDGGITDENGYFSTGEVAINGPCKNISVSISGLTNTDRANAIIYITDEGNAYEYPTPEYVIVPGVDKSGYTNIYPYGDVTDISVSVQVDAGAQAEIESVMANVNAPFVFKTIRFVLVLGFSVLLYAVFTETCIHTIYCERKNKKQLFVIVVFVVFFLLLGYKLVTSNPKCVESPWLHHGQYQELAYCLDSGTVALPYQASPELLAKENPYDTIALQAENIAFHMDYAYYDGQYYVYFGPVPEFLLYYPYFKQTGESLPNYIAFYYFYAAFIVGVFGLLWELVHKLTQKLPFYLYLMLCVGVCLFPNYVFMAGRPDLYNIPIMSGTAFTMCGIWFWLRGLAAQKTKGVYYALGSLCMALVAGCRPQLLLYSAIALPLFFKETVTKRNLFSKKGVKDTLCFVLPYVLIACFVFWYNAARFGNGFDFGATYSLTSNDMNTRGFNLSRLVHGLYSYLFQPPVIDSSYPFLSSSNLSVNYMGRNITEFMFGGIFAVNPLLWILPYALFLGGHKKLDIRTKWMSAILAAAGFIIVCFDINGAGNLQRYASDMVPGFLLAAVIVWLVILGNSYESCTQNSYQKWAKLFTIFTICGLAFAFLTFIAKGDSVCLIKNNAPLFYNIESYFKF